MVSNSLTNRRRTARKPPVCHSGPAVDSILFPPQALQRQRTPLEKKLPGIADPIVPRSGRCPPPPPPTVITCSILHQDPGPYYTGEEYQLNMLACNTTYGSAQLLTPSIETVIGEITEQEDITNCGAGDEAIYQAPDDPGTETITITITWPDSSICISILTFDVLEE
jgi:hypothetical protein